MSQYIKECIFCKTKIQMSDKAGKWLPYNQDSSLHDCKKKLEDNNNVNDAVKQIEKENQRATITLEMVQKKLESIGIIINVERLMIEQ